MKFLPLVLANLRRHKLRTILTICSVALALFLFASLRTVVTTPASINTCANRLICSDFERTRPDSGNGLNGIRLNLHGTSRVSASSSLPPFRSRISHQK